MEELHAAAYAYYSRGNENTHRLACDFFRSMDTNGNGRISYAEFNDFVQQSGYNWILLNDPNLFAKLDRNRDGGLDFQEVLTFYYIIKTRYSITCQSCREQLCGLYFTCVECFDGVAADYRHHHHHYPTYELCAACYGNANYTHQHAYFLDNHVLLHSRRGTPPPPNLAMAVITNNYNVNQAVPQIGWNKWFRVFEAFEALELALSIPALLSNCTIM